MRTIKGSIIVRRRPQDAVSYSILCDYVIGTNVSTVPIQVLRSCGSNHEILDYDSALNYQVDVVKAVSSRADYSIVWQDGDEVGTMALCLVIQLDQQNNSSRFGKEYPIKLVDKNGTMLAYANITSSKITQDDIDGWKTDITPKYGDDYLTPEDIEDLTGSVKDEVLGTISEPSETGFTLGGVTFRNGNIIVGQGDDGVIISKGGIDIFKKVTTGLISSQQQVSLNSTGMCGGSVSATCSGTASGETDNGESSDPDNGTDEEDSGTGSGSSGIKDPNAGNGLTTSDMRLKQVVSEIELTTKQIADAPLFDFKFNNSSVIHSGTSAQYWKQLLPNIVKEDNEGMLSMQYAQAALIAVVSLARRVNELENEIRIIKNK